MGGLLTDVPGPGEAPRSFLERAVDAARSHLGADVGFFAEFVGDEKVIRHATANAEAMGLGVGSRFPLQDTYCYRVACGELPNAVPDTRADDRVSALPITSRLAIGAYVGVPILRADGRPLGTLCCISRGPAPGIGDHDLKLMRFLGDLIGSQMRLEMQAGEQRERRREAILGVLRDGGPRLVFQPIVSLGSQRVIGVEALSRFDAEPMRPPDLWFHDAWDVGLGIELELAAVGAALVRLPQLPDDVYLSVNVSPATLQAPGFAGLIATVPAQRVVIEITEHAVVDDYGPLVGSLAHLRELGIRVAIDDIGAGYSGLKHALRIAPRIGKLDMSLTRDVDTDPVKQALVTAVVSFATRTGLHVVAEGVETAAEAATLRVLGIQSAQGYFFAKPGPLPLAPA